MSVPRLELLTPPGRGGIASLRLTAVAHRPSPLQGAQGQPRPWPAAGQVRHVRWMHGGDLVDDCVVIGRGEGVEVHVHGGAGVVQRLAASLALPLSEASSAPLGAPSGVREARAQASARWGWMARLAAEVASAEASGHLPAQVQRQVREALERAPLGARLARPPAIRLVGRANAGKSTLFNALLAEGRALVSSEAGTTRDAVGVRWQLAGVRVGLADTAGVDGVVHGDGADVLVRVRNPGQEHAPLVGGSGHVLRVCTHGDRVEVEPRPGELLVSGRTGAGVDDLREALVEALGLAGEAADDVRAPLDEAFVRRLRAVLDLG